MDRELVVKRMGRSDEDNRRLIPACVNPFGPLGAGGQRRGRGRRQAGAVPARLRARHRRRDYRVPHSTATKRSACSSRSSSCSTPSMSSRSDCSPRASRPRSRPTPWVRRRCRYRSDQAAADSDGGRLVPVGQTANHPSTGPPSPQARHACRTTCTRRHGTTRHKERAPFPFPGTAAPQRAQPRLIEICGNPSIDGSCGKSIIRTPFAASLLGSSVRSRAAVERTWCR
jgi:hypothetical protein